MLCDRCLWNGECETFEPGGDCGYERGAFESIVESLMEAYGLDDVVDRLLAERAAMYLIRLARGEAYEVWRGVKAAEAWGSYMMRLEKTLMAILRELAVTRRARREMEARNALHVDLEELIRRFVARAEQMERRRRKKARRVRMVERLELPTTPEVYRRVLEDWLRSRS
jgi:hypothetical protein